MQRYAQAKEVHLLRRPAAYDCLLYRQVKIIDALPVMVYTLSALLSLCSISQNLIRINKEKALKEKCVWSDNSVQILWLLPPSCAMLCRCRSTMPICLRPQQNPAKRFRWGEEEQRSE